MNLARLSICCTPRTHAKPGVIISVLNPSDTMMRHTAGTEFPKGHRPASQVFIGTTADFVSNKVEGKDRHKIVL